MIDPAWAMVLVIVVGQFGAAVWIIATLRGQVQLVRQQAEAADAKAEHAKKSAGEAHGRIDKLYNRGGPQHGKA